MSQQFFNTLTEEVGGLQFWCPNYAVIVVDGRQRVVDVETFRDVWVEIPESVPA